VKRHYDGTARVIPIILETCGWKYGAFSQLQVLPKDGKPVTRWDDKAEAFFDVEEGIRRVVDALIAERQRQAEAARQQRQEEDRRQREAEQLKQQREAAQRQQAEVNRQAQERQKRLAASLGISLNDLSIVEFQSVRVNETGNITERQQGQMNTFREDLGNSIGLEMVAIPAGEFVMGSPTEEEGRDNDEGPQRTVRVPSFFMGRFQLTQAQYEAVMGKNPSHFKGINRPVEQVSWDDAVAFCQKLSERTGRTYRLPSEAEWEYACRAGTTTPFHFGPTITTDLVNYSGNHTYGAAPKGKYRQQTTDVGSFLPNAFGLYDMHGNVREWCLDHWHDSYEGAPTDGSAWLSSDESESRLLRGGSWSYDPSYCRSANRSGGTRAFQFNYFGFRLVCASSWAL
jgi:formylglycine-generating enzyme required for sulfatase activity